MKLKLITLLFLAFSICTNAQPVLQGPDAPAATFTYSNGVFEMTLSNPGTSNNYNEMYLEMDTTIDPNAPSQLMDFQGYIIYQVAHDSILQSELDDISLSRIVGQSDLQDTIIDCYNTLYDQVAQICVPTMQVSGNNAGTQYVYNFDVDVFTGGPYIDGQSYCFVPVAYAVNPWRTHPNCPNSPNVFIRSKKGPTGGGLLYYCVNADIDVSDGPEVSKDIDVQIFPNPAQDQLTIQCSSDVLQSIVITDATGRIVHTSATTKHNTQLDVSALPAGVYFVNVRTNDHSYTQKVLKQ